VTDRHQIGWGRAIGSALAIVLVGFLGAVYLPNKLLISSGDPSTLLKLGVSSITLGVVIALAVVLRILQRRGQI
jgi:hypothetical protein